MKHPVIADTQTEEYVARQLLSTLWMRPEYIPLVAQTLSHDGLLLPTAEYVWQVIKSHVGNNKLDVPRALVAIHRHQDASAFFRQAQEENYSPNRYNERQISEWANVLAEQGLRRLGMGIARQIHASMKDGAISLDEAVTQAMQELSGLRSRGGENTWRSQDDIAEESLAILDAMERGEVADGVMTGFPSIDAVLSGGFPNGEFVLIGARPSVGKTSFALDLAFNMAENWHKTGSDKCVAFFSAETTGPKLQFRMAYALAGVNQAKARAGRASKDEIQAVKDAIAYIKRLPIYIDESSRPTTKNMLLRAMALDNATIGGKRKRVGIIFFDFIELAGDQDSNEVLRVGKISDGLKELAKLMKIPVIGLCQIKREADGVDKIPTLSDLRWSATLEQNSYIVIFLHRASYHKKRTNLNYNPQTDPDHNKAIVMVAKHKDGAIGPVEMLFEEEFSSFSDPRQQKNQW